jgi:hypothetical protein
MFTDKGIPPAVLLTQGKKITVLFRFGTAKSMKRTDEQNHHRPFSPGIYFPDKYADNIFSDTHPDCVSTRNKYSAMFPEHQLVV